MNTRVVERSILHHANRERQRLGRRKFAGKCSLSVQLGLTARVYGSTMFTKRLR